MGIKINQIELLAQGVLTDSTTTCIIYTYFTGCLIDISSIIYSIHSMQMQTKALEINRLIKVEDINYCTCANITRYCFETSRDIAEVIPCLRVS